MHRAFVIALLLFATAVAQAATAVDDGGHLYRDGRLPDGSAVRGTRVGGADVTGIAAACINCHRRSGLGAAEGQILIPPVTGEYLFRPLEKNVKDLSLPHVYGVRATRSPYTDATLARAIREGIDSDGRPLNYLMPRFQIDDATMTSLIAYLKGLTPAAVPGVGDEVLHFATIITPDADPATKQAMLEVMNKFFEDKNAFIRGGVRTLRSNSHAIMYRVSRRWQLHVWQLSGPPEDWERQLRAKLQAEPVFAVISGLGGKTWAPVHRFCEAEAIPCLFPNVDVPVDAEHDFYSIYFSKGILLEAQLIAHRLHDDLDAHRPARVIQVYREGDIGVDGARATAQALAATGLKTVDRPLKGNDVRALHEALHDIDARDALILWLRPQDLSALPATGARAGAVFTSGIMGGFEESQLPAAWRSAVRMAYPFDLPDLRRVRMNYPLGWFRIRRIKLVDERVQTDTYTACGILAETLQDMLDSFVRDYLIERIESMLSHRLITGYYPRLSLAPGQRFASKGGYLVRFPDPTGARVVADGDWTVP